jgi:hypothetical protein
MTGEDQSGKARYAMSDEDVARQFPYGLPAWLQAPVAPRPVERDGATRYENVVFLEHYRRR